MRFGIAAALAAVAAALYDPAAARRMARSPAVVILTVLAVFGAISATWTVGLTGDALRWALVTAGFAAVIVAAGVLARDARAVVAIAAGLALLAVAIGIIGLVGAAETIVPLAHREAGRWRPAATFQYSPALALLLVGALPALLRGMCLGGSGARVAVVRCASAFGAAVAGAVFGLAESRTELAFAAIVCAAALAWPRRTVGARQSQVFAAVALIGAAALGAYAVAGGYVVVTPPPDGTLRLLKLGAVVLGAAIAWGLARPLVTRRGAVAALGVAAVLAAGGAVAAATKPAALLISPGLAPAHAAHHVAHPEKLDPIRDRLLHGRLKIWRAAWYSFEDRPLKGGGADSFWFASADHQGDKTVFYAHELPLELAAELGIGGLVLALALYVACGRALWRARQRDGPAFWLLGPPAAAFLAANLVDWPWHFAGSGAVWAAAFGAILARPGTDLSPP